MKNLLIVILLATLGGCVVVPSAPYETRVPQQRFDPYQWHTVPSQPSRVEYTSEPVYVSRPAYIAPPVYAPQPYYYDPMITFGLGLVIGNSWRGGRGYYGRRHR